MTSGHPRCRPCVVSGAADAVATVARLLEHPEPRAGSPGRRPVVLIDGGSGSGKTELGEALAARLGAALVHLDDFYPGWDGLAEASHMVVDDVLRADGPGWRRWDWERGASAEWHAVPERGPLVVEGSGSLTRASRALASVAIWIDLSEPERKRRALARDGELYRPHWERWAAQEREHLMRDRPDELADIVVAEARERGA